MPRTSGEPWMSGMARKSGTFGGWKVDGWNGCARTEAHDPSWKCWPSIATHATLLPVNNGGGEACLILFVGIVVFLGVHSLTIFRETRTSLIERFGLGPFKGL